MDGFWKDSYFSSSTSFSSRNYVGRSKCEGRKSVNFLRTIQLRVTRVSGLTADIRRFSIEKTRIITDARSSRTNLSRESYSVSSIVKKKKKKISRKRKSSRYFHRAPVIITRIELNSAQRCLFRCSIKRNREQRKKKKWKKKR